MKQDYLSRRKEILKTILRRGYLLETELYHISKKQDIKRWEVDIAPNAAEEARSRLAGAWIEWRVSNRIPKGVHENVRWKLKQIMDFSQE